MMFRGVKSANIPQDMLDEVSKKRKQKAPLLQPEAKRNKDETEKIPRDVRFKCVLAPKQLYSSDSDAESDPDDNGISAFRKAKQRRERVIKKAKRTLVPMPMMEEKVDEETFSNSEDDDDDNLYQPMPYTCTNKDSTDSDYEGDDDSDAEFSFGNYKNTDQNEIDSDSDEDEEMTELKDCENDDVEMTDSPKSYVEIFETMRMDVSEKPNNFMEVDEYQVSEEEEGLEMEYTKLYERSTFIECIKNGSLVRLNDIIYFHGIIDIRPIINSVQVNGYTIKAGESLKAESISHADYFLNMTPVITGTYNDADKKKLTVELKQLVPDEEVLKEFFTGFDFKKDVLVHINAFPPSCAINMINKYVTNKVLQNKAMILKNCANPSSEHFLDAKFFVNEENPRLNSFLVNEDWNNIDMNQDSKIMIVGGKNVGKSALAQYTINRNINKFKRILLIDLDIGQPIIGLAQTVSATVITKPLIGAGYLSDAKPIKSLLYGDKSIMTSPYAYINCVKELVKFCSDEYSDIPWIINSLGYQKGYGLELCAVLSRIIYPSDVVQIQHQNLGYNFNKIITMDLVNHITFSFFDQKHLDGINEEVIFTTHVLDSMVNNNNNQGKNDFASMNWKSNATDKRKMSLLAHLSKLTKDGQPYLNDVPPTSSSTRRIRMMTIDKKYEITPGITDSKLFNGNLVYLCSSPDSYDSALPDSVFNCLGLGLVRAVDNLQDQIYLLMPQNEQDLVASVNTLALGYMQLPSELTIKQHFGVGGKVPYVTKQEAMPKHINKRNIKDLY